jgi:predicted nucleic acid-binding protein
VPDASIRSLLELFRDPEHVLLVAPAVHVTINCCDAPADNVFLECALAAQTDYVVSGDRHLQEVKTFRGIRILPPREYLTLLE